MDEHEVSWIDPAELLAAIPDGPVGNGAISEELVRAEVSAPVGLAVDGGVLQVEAGTAVTLRGLGSAGHRDPDRVVGVSPVSPRRSPAWRPLLEAGARYWLKYAVQGRLEPSGAVDDGLVDLDGDATAEVVLADYRAHEPGENARDAVAEDLAHPRWAVRAKDLRRLGPDDAVLLTTRAQLRVGVHVRWADVAQVALSRLAEVLSPGSLLQVRIDLASLVRVRARLTQDLAVVFARRPDGAIRVQVRTSDTSVRARRAALAVESELVGDGVPDAIVAAVLDGWLGAPRASVASVLEAASVDGLEPAERELLRELLVRLGLGSAGDLVQALAAVRQRWHELESEVRERLEAAAQGVVTAGLETEVERLERDTVLVEADLTEDAAVRVHGQLIGGDVEALVEAADRGTGEVVLRDSWTEQLAQTTAVWGFSLGLGEWRLEAEDRRKRSWRWRTGSDGRQRAVFLGCRRYRSTDPVSGRGAHWSVDLKAASDWIPSAPSLADLELGLHLAYGHDERRLSRREVAAFVDEAVVWHAVDDADREEVEAAVRAAVGRRKVTTRLELHLDHAALIAALTTLATEDEVAATDRLARAMARALPAVGGFPSREITALREQLYAPVWKAWLVYQDLEDDDLAAATERALRHTPVGKAVARLEGRQQRLGEQRPAWTVAEVARRDPDTRTLWWSLRHGMRALMEARAAVGEPVDVLESAVASMERFWAQAYHVRVLGAALARAVDGRAPLRATFSVTVPNADERLVVTTTR